MRLWIRAGDGDTYHDFDGTDEAADYLFELGAVADLMPAGEYSLTGDRFQGWDDISAYWGERADDPARSLTGQEVVDLNAALRDLARQYA
jgi:hypothetical protein